MQSLMNCGFTLDVEVIDNITGANQYFEIYFSAKNKTQYKITFDSVWDMRYSIENASIDRFCQFRKCLPAGIIENGIYLVNNSEYIKYFEHQVSGTRPIDELKHYILSDEIDTTLDILTTVEPLIEKLSNS